MINSNFESTDGFAMKIYYRILLLLVTLPAMAQESPTNPQKLLSEVRDGLVSMRAQFTQYEVNEDNQRGEVNQGLVWLKAPDQFRWHYQQPIEQLIVADGKQVWVYDEDLEQVTVKAQNNDLNPIYVIINKELSEQHYNIKFETEHEGTSWVSLTPKTPSEEVKTVWLAIKDKQLTQIKVVNHLDQTMIFEFLEAEKNPELAPGLFQFKPPAGVDVIQAHTQDAGGEF